MELIRTATILLPNEHRHILEAVFKEMQDYVITVTRYAKAKALEDVDRTILNDRVTRTR